MFFVTVRTHTVSRFYCGKLALLTYYKCCVRFPGVPPPPHFSSPTPNPSLGNIVDCSQSSNIEAACTLKIAFGVEISPNLLKPYNHNVLTNLPVNRLRGWVKRKETGRGPLGHFRVRCAECPGRDEPHWRKEDCGKAGGGGGGGGGNKINYFPMVNPTFCIYNETHSAFKLRTKTWSE